MKNCLHLTFAASLALVSTATAQVDFVKDIQPLLEAHCTKCHGEDQKKGGLRLHTLADTLKGGDSGTALVAGKSKDSRLYTSTTLKPDDDGFMPPPKEGVMPKELQAKLREWIDAGAKWPAGLKLGVTKKINFAKDIQPIFEFNCVSCHKEGHAKGGLRMETRELTLKGGESGAGVVPFQPAKSPVHTSTIVSKDDEKLMPPVAKDPLAKEEIEFIRLWIQQGAVWPDGLVLVQKKKEVIGANENETVATIHKFITATHKEKTPADMKAYTNAIVGTEVSYSVVPIPAGQFSMGSPLGEKGRDANEGPQRTVKISPFWMGTHEITWNEFELFMYVDEEKKFKDRIKSNDAIDKVSDAVARPTKPYVEMSFGMGKDGYPAISMTQHAANKYCQWLSAKTGHFYRLPTEAEWEYAARAGTKTAYSWGDDVADAKQYAWFEANSDFKYQKVGKKKPNPWGLYDIHGNVAEWCMDQYEPNYEKVKTALVDPWLKQASPYPQAARGGSWDDGIAKLRSAARRGSDKSWKQQDPQLPKSIWYLTDAQFLGFRIVRPLNVPSAEEMLRYWNSGQERE
ncbi:MAG: SUMF1/EgtB/PvdO family nonheme iron enzyme [Verrucomicrobia bacterium]|nr:SUMF1/EgtB/PvdO family nonheme iron enzyme [Verrucomicrobiota bacterium]